MSSLGDIRPRIAPIAAAIVFGVISWMKMKLIANCLISCAGSCALLALHPGRWSETLGSGSAEFWIAGIVWCSAPFFIARSILVPSRTARRLPVRAARAALYVFAFVSFTAPITAPLPPLAQGSSLTADRFLPPLSDGVRSESVAPLQPAVADAGVIERAVGSADQYLLHRTVSFSHEGGGNGSAHAPAAPSVANQSSIKFVLGTDGVGRDILSRVIYGTRYSLGIGFIVVLLSLSLGTAAGMLSGYAGGLADSIIMRTVDVFLSVPSLFLALMLMAILGQSLTTMVIVLSATGWMGSARLMRGEVTGLRQREFIAASRLLGTSNAGILRLHVLPNIFPTVRNAGILQLGNIILAEASLSFLGLGVQSPEPSWGNMIADSMGYGGAAVFPAVFPGIALTVLIIAVHLVGERSW